MGPAVAAVVSAVVSAVALAGCAGGGSAASAGPVSIDIELVGDEVSTAEPRVVVGVGQPVELVVSSDVVGELGVHDDEELYFDVAPGEQTFEVTLDRPGVIAVETHEPSEQLVLELQVQ